MTIGPEPITQMERRSGRFGKPQLLDPALEQGPGVVRAGACLGMELQRTSPLTAQREPFHGAVIERHVRDLRSVTCHSEAVVLARYEHAVRRDLEHGMVGAAMPERQLEGLEAGCQAEELMPEADPQDRCGAD